MKSIAVTKPDMAVVERDRLGLSLFGLLALAFGDEISTRSTWQTGWYRAVPLDLLEQEEAAPAAPAAPARPAPVELKVDLKGMLDRLHKEQPSAPQRTQTEERILERIYLLERRVEQKVPLSPHVLVRMEQHPTTIHTQTVRDGSSRRPSPNGTAQQNPQPGTPSGRENRPLPVSAPPERVRMVRAGEMQMTRLERFGRLSAPLTPVVSSTVVPAGGGWSPRWQAEHPGFPQKGQAEAVTSAAGSILLPDLLRQRRRQAQSGALPAEETGLQYRLPDEAEPQHAARALRAEAEMQQMVQRLDRAVERAIRRVPFAAEAPQSAPQPERIARPESAAPLVYTEAQPTQAAAPSTQTAAQTSQAVQRLTKAAEQSPQATTQPAQMAAKSTEAAAQVTQMTEAAQPLQREHSTALPAETTVEPQAEPLEHRAKSETETTLGIQQTAAQTTQTTTSSTKAAAQPLKMATRPARPEVQAENAALSLTYAETQPGQPTQVAAQHTEPTVQPPQRGNNTALPAETLAEPQAEPLEHRAQPEAEAAQVPQAVSQSTQTARLSPQAAVQATKAAQSPQTVGQPIKAATTSAQTTVQAEKAAASPVQPLAQSESITVQPSEQAMQPSQREYNTALPAETATELQAEPLEYRAQHETEAETGIQPASQLPQTTASSMQTVSQSTKAEASPVQAEAQSIKQAADVQAEQSAAKATVQSAQTGMQLPKTGAVPSQAGQPSAQEVTQDKSQTVQSAEQSELSLQHGPNTALPAETTAELQAEPLQYRAQPETEAAQAPQATSQGIKAARLSPQAEIQAAKVTKSHHTAVQPTKIATPSAQADVQAEKAAQSPQMAVQPTEIATPSAQVAAQPPKMAAWTAQTETQAENAALPLIYAETQPSQAATSSNQEAVQPTETAAQPPQRESNTALSAETTAELQAEPLEYRAQPETEAAPDAQPTVQPSQRESNTALPAATTAELQAEPLEYRAQPETETAPGIQQTTAQPTKTPAPSARTGAQPAQSMTSSAKVGAQPVQPSAASAKAGAQSVQPATSSAKAGAQPVQPTAASAKAGAQSAKTAVPSAGQQAVQVPPVPLIQRYRETETAFRPIPSVQKPIGRNVPPMATTSSMPVQPGDDLTYLPVQPGAAQVPPTAQTAAAANSGAAQLPEWAQRFLQQPAQTGAVPQMGSAPQHGTAGSPPPVGNKPKAQQMIEWTAPNAMPSAASIVYAEQKPKPAAQQPQQQPVRLSDSELRRAADKVYRMIEDRLRKELRRSGK